MTPRHVVPDAVFIAPAEQPAAGRPEQTANQRGDPAIAELGVLPAPGLAREVECDERAVHAHVPPSDRRQTEAAVVSRVDAAAGPERAAPDDAAHRREHAAPAETALAQVLAQRPAQARERGAEAQHAISLPALARPLVIRVIPVLEPSGGVGAHRLHSP